MKKIKLNVYQIAILLLIRKNYDFGIGINNQLSDIDLTKKYPGGIPSNCDDVFELLISNDEIDCMKKALNNASGDETFKQGWGEINQFKVDFLVLSDRADYELCKIVILIGKISLSKELRKTLKKKKVGVVFVQNKEEAEKLIEEKWETSVAGLQFYVIASTNVDEKIIQDIYDVLDAASIMGVIVHRMGKFENDDEPSQPVDFHIDSEKRIDWEYMDIGID